MRTVPSTTVFSNLNTHCYTFYVNLEGMQSELTVSSVFLSQSQALLFLDSCEWISSLEKHCGESIWTPFSLWAIAGGTKIFVCIFSEAFSYLIRFVTSSDLQWSCSVGSSFFSPKRCPKSLHPKTKILAGSQNFTRLCNG